MAGNEGPPRSQKKPMRMRFMELPTIYDGDDSHEQYIIVLDRVSPDYPPVDRGTIAKQTGARGVLTFTHEIQLGEDPE